MRKALRRTALGLIALIASAGAVIIALGWRSPRDEYVDFTPRPIPIASDADAIARGEYLTQSILACTVCHGVDLAGRLMSDSPIYGRVFTPNLTRGTGGVGDEYTDVDWVRAIRHGLARDGRVFAFMPVDHYYHVPDGDLADVIAYLKSLPPVNNGGAEMKLGLLPKAIINSGFLGDLVRPKLIQHDAPRPRPVQDRGAYLSLIGGCDFCHGVDLRGGQGPEPGAPPGPDLTGKGFAGRHSFDEFVMAMRFGVTPRQTPIKAAYMPWLAYRNLADEDLRLLYDYLQALPDSGPHIAQRLGMHSSGMTE